MDRRPKGIKTCALSNKHGNVLTGPKTYCFTKFSLPLSLLKFANFIRLLLEVKTSLISYNPDQKSWDTFAKTPQIRASPLHPQCNVDLKGSSHQESLQALSTLLGVGGGRAVTKTV